MWIDGRKLGGSWAAVSLSVLVVGSAGCALGGDAARELGELSGPERTTVIVENTGLDAIAIYSSVRRARLATVMPGGERCVELPYTSDMQQLLARPVGGGKAIASPRFELRDGDGWSWSIGVNPVASELSLTPSRQCVQG